MADFEHVNVSCKIPSQNVCDYRVTVMTTLVFSLVS